MKPERERHISHTDCDNDYKCHLRAAKVGDRSCLTKTILYSMAFSFNIRIQRSTSTKMLGVKPKAKLCYWPMGLADLDWPGRLLLPLLADLRLAEQ